MTRPRWTTRANPHLAGDTVVLTFRCPRPVANVIDGLVAARRPGIDTRTDALQDAVVLWARLEEHDMEVETNGNGT